MPRKYDLREIARSAMIARGLLPEFSGAVLAEVRAGAGRDSVPREQRDLRNLLWCSIDNDDSRDLDQLTVAESAGDAVRILVAIADVDSRVPRGGPIDTHAATNTTSVYTVARVFTMLPEQLSYDETSLVQDQDRPAIAIEFVVAGDGVVQSSNVFPALVRNRAKLAYDAVAAWLEGQGPAPAALAAVPGLEEQLRMQDRVAQVLRTVRYRQGALTLETIEPRATFDAGGALIDLRPQEKNRARALIEDLMIAANMATARFLAAHNMPSLRRVLSVPKRWDRIVDLARASGARLPGEPDCAALQRFLDDRRAEDPEHFPDLSLSVVKLLGSGEYVLERPGEQAQGHFGLAVRDYTHSTAPNRRFPDVITQRLLKAALSGGGSPYSDGELAALAGHCTAQEDNAAKVERQVRKSAAALLLSSRIDAVFEGIVTGASDKGTWVRILRPAVEGRVVRGEAGLDVGDHVRVRLLSTDVERGFIDFARTGDHERARR